MDVMDKSIAISREQLNLDSAGIVKGKFVADAEEFNESTVSFASWSPVASIVACRNVKY